MHEQDIHHVVHGTSRPLLHRLGEPLFTLRARDIFDNARASGGFDYTIGRALVPQCDAMFREYYKEKGGGPADGRTGEDDEGGITARLL
jgi:hypothetical protein